MFWFIIYKQETVDHTVNTTEVEPVISSTEEIIEEECIASKIVQDSHWHKRYYRLAENIDFGDFDTRSNL